MKKTNPSIEDESLLRKCLKCGKNIQIELRDGKDHCFYCHGFGKDHSISDIQSVHFQTPMQGSSHHIKKFNSLNFQSMDVEQAFAHNKNFLNKTLPITFSEPQDSQDEVIQRLKVEQKKLKQSIRNNKLKLKAEKKIIVGSGFTFDMTDFFKFKKKELAVQGKPPQFFEQISGSRVAWLILLYTICSTAFIPGWIMNIKANKLLRQCWRFLMQALMVLPFVFYQKRTASEQNKEKYTLSYIFNPQNIIKPFIASLSACCWFLFVLTSFQWTLVSHGLVLGGLSNFFLSISRSLHKNSHDLQSGGQVLVILGVLLVIHDSLSVEKKQIPAETFQFLNIFYLTRTWWERLGGDLLAIFTSYLMSQFSKYTSDMRSYYPPFLSMMLVNIFNVANLILIAFFFNGASFDFDPFWGIFSVLSDSHFISFMYMAIVLAFGQMVSVFLITKMFPDPIIPALAMTIQPYLACFFVDLAKIQNLPGNFAMIGFILIFPGMLLVLMGQCFYQRQQQSNKQQTEKMKKIKEEIQLYKSKKMERQTHLQLRKQRALNNSGIQEVSGQHKNRS